jgi:hypothetical protein
MADTELQMQNAVRSAARPPGRRLLVVGAWAVVAAVLFACYFGLSRSYPENSDEANLVLMAHDMLNGNLLLHGWYLSDVSFITYDLPQLTLVESLFGWTFTAAHVSVALTFTLVVLIGALLARGRAAEVDSRTGLVRMLLAGGIMFAPLTGSAVFVLLLSIGHIGTAVPVLLAWLVADRLGNRWHVPIWVALLLAWAAVGDSLVLVIGIWPLMLVAVVRMLGWLARKRSPRELVTECRLELSLLVAGAAAWGLFRLLTLLLSDSKGYYLNPLPYQVSHPQWATHFKLTGTGLRIIFGVDPGAQNGVGIALAWLHVAGLALAIVGLGFALWRFFSWPTDLISQLLVVGILANLAAYVPSSLVTSAINVREVAPVLPLSAVLAGRQLGPMLARYMTKFRAVAVVSGLVLAGYAWSLIAGALQPAAPIPYADLAASLESHHLRYGLGTYWQSSVVTVQTQGKVTIRAMTDCVNMPYPSSARGTLFQIARTCNQGPPSTPTGGVKACEITPYPWETNVNWYDPKQHKATFIVQDEDPVKYPYDPRGPANLGGALLIFGRTKDFKPLYFGHAGTISFPPYHVTYYTRVYTYNLLRRVPAIRTGQCS